LRPAAVCGHNGVMDTQPLENVTASEIGDYVFDPQVWGDRITGKAKADQAMLDDGTRLHARKEAAVHASTGSIALGRILVVIALIALAVLWAMNR
jgi:hypothetical protein